MSEADVIREAIGTDLGEYEIQEPLAALDSLTTRLAEVERERDELAQRIVEADEQDALRERLAEVERENDLVRHENHEARSQLTQAREALEQIPHMDGRHHDGLLVGCPGCIARQALATMEPKTEEDKT